MQGSGGLTDLPVTSGSWWKGAAKAIAGWFGEEKVTGKAAALSFYTAFSLAPIVLLLMLLFGLVVDTQTLQTQLIAQSTSLLGEQGGQVLLET